MTEDQIKNVLKRLENDEDYYGDFVSSVDIVINT